MQLPLFDDYRILVSVRNVVDEGVVAKVDELGRGQVEGILGFVDHVLAVFLNVPYHLQHQSPVVHPRIDPTLFRDMRPILDHLLLCLGYGCRAKV